ncbi:MAG: gamma subclass chorismate mutase AroQ [Acidobacteriota bacterium]
MGRAIHLNERSVHPYRFFGLLGIFLVFGCATALSFTASETAKVDNLLSLIGERLEVASEVARNKWNTGTPIEDMPRERQIIEGVENRAAEYGLDSRTAGEFFAGQIEASKVVQRILHAEWASKGQPSFEKVADLGKDIRPALDRLTAAMMQSLVEVLPIIQQPGGRRLLEERSMGILAGHSWGRRPGARQAMAPLLKLSQ